MTCPRTPGDPAIDPTLASPMGGHSIFQSVPLLLSISDIIIVIDNS